MATYAEIYDTWQSETLKKQIVIATVKAAANVIAEPPETPNHNARLAWALKVAADPHLEALRISTGVILNETIASGQYTDADVQTVVNVLVNVFANLP